MHVVMVLLSFFSVKTSGVTLACGFWACDIGVFVFLRINICILNVWNSACDVAWLDETTLTQTS